MDRRTPNAERKHRLNREIMAPHSLTLTLVGTGMLWVGWFGFNAGSALEANGSAALAMINTFVATASGALAWLAGAAVIAAAQWVFSWRTELRSRSAPAVRMFSRLLLGTVLKWLVVGAGLVLAMTNGLPPAHVLGGASLAALAQIFSLPWLLR